MATTPVEHRLHAQHAVEQVEAAGRRDVVPRLHVSDEARHAVDEHLVERGVRVAADSEILLEKPDLDARVLGGGAMWNEDLREYANIVRMNANVDSPRRLNERYVTRFENPPTKKKIGMTWNSHVPNHSPLERPTALVR